MTCKNCGEALVWVELETGGQGVRHEGTGRMLCGTVTRQEAAYDYPTKVIPTTNARGEHTGRFVARCSCGWKFDGPGPDGLEYMDANTARVAHGGGHFPEPARRGIPGMSSAF